MYTYTQRIIKFVLLYIRNSILRAESCHPKHVTKNLQIGEYIRAKRSCTTQDDYEREILIIDQRLSERL